MVNQSLTKQMEAYVQKLMDERGYTRHDAENEAYDIFIGADERVPEPYYASTREDYV